MYNQPNYGYYPVMPNPCECGYYHPMYPMYPPYDPYYKPYDNSCLKSCEIYRDFVLDSEIEGDVLTLQSVTSAAISAKLMALANSLNTQLKLRQDELSNVIPQVYEAKQKYDECIVKCEKDGYDCNCSCNCCNCCNEPTSYCPECEPLRTTYENLLRKQESLAGEILELGLDIPTIECYADIFKRRASLLKEEGDEALAQAQEYNNKYYTCIAKCNSYPDLPPIGCNTTCSCDCSKPCE